MIENEAHPLITCLAYDNLRVTLLTQAYVNGLSEGTGFSIIMV